MIQNSSNELNARINSTLFTSKWSVPIFIGINKGQKGQTSKKKNSNRKIKVVQRTKSSSEKTNLEKKLFVKEIEFVDDLTNDSTLISWPKLNTSLANKYEPSTKLSELGRIFLRYLNELGLTKSSLTSGATTKNESKEVEKDDHSLKKYYCNLEFNVKYRSETFIINLHLIYRQAKASNIKLPPSLLVTNEELLNYLKDKIIFKKADNAEFEKRINTLLHLSLIKCYINNLELDI